MKFVLGILLAGFLVSFGVNDKHGLKAPGKNDWVGSYVNEYGMVLNVRTQTLTDITFEIVNKKGECQESFRGKAMLVNNTRASYKDNSNYNDDENLLTITLDRRSDGKIEVSETGFQHAPDCLTFSGIFKPSY